MNDGVTVHHLREAETGEADVGTFEFFDQLLGSFLLGVVVVVVLCSAPLSMGLFSVEGGFALIGEAISGVAGTDVSTEDKPSSSMDSSGAERLARKDSNTGVMVNTPNLLRVNATSGLFVKTQDVDIASSVRTHGKHLVAYGTWSLLTLCPDDSFLLETSSSFSPGLLLLLPPYWERKPSISRGRTHAETVCPSLPPNEMYWFTSRDQHAPWTLNVPITPPTLFLFHIFNAAFRLYTRL